LFLDVVILYMEFKLSDKRDFKLKAAWLQAFEFASRTNKNKSYLSQLDKDIDIEHDAILRMKILEFQQEGKMLDNSTLSEISMSAYEEASSTLTSIRKQEQSSIPNTVRAVMEMGVFTQDFICSNEETKYIVMGNIFTEGLSDEEIEMILSIFRQYEAEYFQTQDFISIVLFSIDTRMIPNEERLDKLSEIHTKMTHEHARKSFIKLGRVDLASYIRKYPLFDKIRDYIDIHFG